MCAEYTNSDMVLLATSAQPRGVPTDADMWKYYIEEAEQHDKGSIGDWNQTMDVILVFVSSA